MINNQCENSYHTLTDEKLVEKTHNGDELAFNTLFDRYLPIVKLKSGSYSTADKDDLIQEGLVGLWGAVQTYSFDKNTSFKTYASKCIENRMISGIKRNKGIKHIPSDMLVYIDGEDSEHIKLSDISPEQNMIERENYYSVIKRIKEILSDKEFKVFSYYLSGYSYTDIAVFLKCNVKSVDNAIQRIRKKLRIHYS